MLLFLCQTHNLRIKGVFLSLLAQTKWQTWAKAEMSYVFGPAATEQNPPHPNQTALQSKALTTDRGFLMTQQSYAMPKILHWERLLGRHSHQEFTVKWKDRFSCNTAECLTFSFSTYYSNGPIYWTCARFDIFVCMYANLS